MFWITSVDHWLIVVQAKLLLVIFGCWGGLTYEGEIYMEVIHMESREGSIHMEWSEESFLTSSNMTAVT